MGTALGAAYGGRMSRPRVPRTAFLGPLLVLAAAAVIGCGADGGPAASTTRTLTAVDAAGGSDVAGDGRVEELTLTASGGADVDLAELAARDATLAVSGGADATVHARRTLDVDVAGGGDVTYAGRPKVTKRVSAGADLRRR